MSDIFNGSVVEQISEYLKSRAVDSDRIKRELNNWKNVPVNIGVIGERGAGKSMLINALNDRYPSDEGAAGIDAIDCTKFPTPYPYRVGEQNREESAKIVIWDLPGAGTEFYPIQGYLEKITVLDAESLEYVSNK